ncbi:MAG: hypothetical protein ACUVQR_14565, partial [Thermogutta sp.]
PGAWRVVPLIYSPGPDGFYGLDLQGQLRYFDICFDIWNNWYAYPVGAPKDEPDNPDDYLGCHLDNIHNHRAETMP